MEKVVFGLIYKDKKGEREKVDEWINEWVDIMMNDWMND